MNVKFFFKFVYCIECGCYDLVVCFDEVLGGFCSWLVFDCVVGVGVCFVCFDGMECWNVGECELVVFVVYVDVDVDGRDCYG